MNRQKPQPTEPTPRPHLWLATNNGRRLPRTGEPIAPVDAPESVLDVQFEGLTEAEQRAALEGFPGGRRFRLATTQH
jgi:hypothetical protein